jgi:cysteinyl-tRNA synthetase
MHNGFVNVDNEKMSKSLGNFFTVRDLCEKYDGQTIRFYLLTTHYRSPINFSDVALDEAAARLKYLCETQARLQQALQGKDAESAGTDYREPWVGSIVTRFDEAMADDFNTAKALGELSDVFKLVNEILDKPGDEATDSATLLTIQNGLGQIGQVLGIFLEDPNLVLERMAGRRQLNQGVDAERVDRLVVERREARGSRDFKRADEIRDELAAMGVVLKDQGGQTTWELM